MARFPTWLDRPRSPYSHLCNILHNQVRIIHEEMDRSSGNSSAGYVLLAGIKIVVILFIITAVIECGFRLRPHLWVLYRYLISFLYSSFVLMMNFTEKTFNCALYPVLKLIWQIFIALMKGFKDCLWSIMIFALSIDWRYLYGRVKMVSLHIKYSKSSLMAGFQCH